MHRSDLRRTAAFVAWLALVAPAALHAQPPPIGDPHDLTQVISVDRLSYPVGTPVQVTRSTCNETAEPIRFNVYGSSAPYLEVLDSDGAVVAFAQADGHDGSIVPITYEPGKCRIGGYNPWFQSAGRFDHLNDPLGPQVPVGTYRVRAPSDFGGDPVVSAPFGIGELPISVPALGGPGLLVLGLGLAVAAAYLLRR